MTNRVSRLGGLFLVTLVALALWQSLPTTGPEAGSAAAIAPAAWIELPPDLGKPLQLPMSPSQGCQPGNILRAFSENWERRDFPANPDNPRWRSVDRYASVPGLLDEIEWGRCADEASLGSASAWSVGGGSSGSQLSCAAKDYPSKLGARCRSDGTCRVQAELQYFTLGLNTPSRNVGLRITLDYKARMPVGALVIGAGDADAPQDAQGRVPVYSDPEAQIVADTGGQWVRGAMLNVVNDAIANKPKVVIVMRYQDDAPADRYYGVFIDNIHVDVLFDPRACPIESPSPTPLPTSTNTPTDTATPIIFPTDTPPPPTRPPAPNYLPSNLLDADTGRLPRVPTAPTATDTPTLTPTPTNTDTPTSTSTPTIPPTATDTPTWTPTPYPDVRIKEVIYTSGAGAQRMEWVTLLNKGTMAQPLAGWRVFEAKRTNTCYIPARVVLGPNEMFQVRSGSAARDGVVDGVDGYRCNASFIWDNNEDEAWLYDDNNSVVDRFCYDRSGWYYCEIPR